MVSTVTTVACRAVADKNGNHISGCGAGWYGKAGDRCPRCGAEVKVTDVYRSIDLTA